jgi:hypothetical protein
MASSISTPNASDDLPSVRIPKTYFAHDSMKPVEPSGYYSIRPKHTNTYSGKVAQLVPRELIHYSIDTCPEHNNKIPQDRASGYSKSFLRALSPPSRVTTTQPYSTHTP